MIHKVVTDGEMKWARVQALEFISEHRSEFRREGVYWGRVREPEEDVGEMESLPDYMTLAIRAEFGINADDRPHWRPALRWIIKRIDDIAKEDKEVQGALHDWLFRGHTLSRNSKERTMDVREFEKEAGEFQRKVMVDA